MQKNQTLIPFLAVAHAEVESGFATSKSGWSTIPGSYNAFGQTASSSQPHVTSSGGRKVYKWSSWSASLNSTEEDWFAGNRRRMNDPTHPLYGKTTIRDYIYTYAPPSENDSDGYVANTVSIINKVAKLMDDPNLQNTNTITSSSSGVDSNLTPSCVNTNTDSSVAGNFIDGDYKSLQEYVLNAPNLQLSEAAKGDVQRGYGSSPAPCKQSNLNINTLRLIKALLVEFPKQKFAIYTIISGHHCNAGFHPKGLGLDLNTQGDTGDTCNNKKGAERMMADVVMPFVFNNKDQLNINEMFYNADDLLNLTLNEGNVYNKKVSGHCDHIHLGVNPG